MKYPILEGIGRDFIDVTEALGSAALMLRSVVFWFFRAKFELAEAIKQAVKIGVDSLAVTALTSFFTGMVLVMVLDYFISALLVAVGI